MSCLLHALRLKVAGYNGCAWSALGLQAIIYENFAWVTLVAYGMQPAGGQGSGGGGSGGGPLDFLRSNPQFQGLRNIVRSNPQILQPMLQVGFCSSHCPARLMQGNT